MRPFLLLRRISEGEPDVLFVCFFEFQVKSIRGRSVLANHSDHNPKYFKGLRINWLHGGIFGLEADPRSFFEESLQSRFLAIDQSDDDVFVAGSLLLFDDDVVSLGDVGLDHGVAMNFEAELLIGLKHVAEVDLVGLFDRGERGTGNDSSQEREGCFSGGAFRELDGTRHIGLAIDQPLLFKGFQVTHDTIGRFDSEPGADFPDSGAVAAIDDLFADKVVDFALPVG